MEQTDNVWKYIANELLPIPLEQLIKSNIMPKDLAKIKIKEKWNISSIIKSWCKLHYKKPISKEEILNENLWFNSSIRKKGNPYYCKQMLSRGITTVRDIYDAQTNQFRPFNDVKQSFGVNNFIEYYDIISNVPAYWKEKLLEPLDNTNTDRDARLMSNVLDRKGKITTSLYWLMIDEKDSNYDHGLITWRLELKADWNRKEWYAIRSHGWYTITMSTKLRMFQYKVLSKKLTTNVLRNKWDNTISPLCYFCDATKETIIHILWECPKVATFWHNLKRWIEYICKIKIEWNTTIIVTNKYEGYENRFINIVILVAKQYIYATKCLGEKLLVKKCINNLHKIFIVEKEISFQTNKLKVFGQRWLCYEKGIIV